MLPNWWLPCCIWLISLAGCVGEMLTVQYRFTSLAQVWSDGINKLSPDVSCVRPVRAPLCETGEGRGVHLQVLGPIGDVHCSNCCCWLHACVHIWAPGQVLGIRAQLQAHVSPICSPFYLLARRGCCWWWVGGRGLGQGTRGSLRTGGRACESLSPVVAVLPFSAERPAWVHSLCNLNATVWRGTTTSEGNKSSVQLHSQGSCDWLRQWVKMSLHAGKRTETLNVLRILTSCRKQGFHSIWHTDRQQGEIIVSCAQQCLQEY